MLTNDRTRHIFSLMCGFVLFMLFVFLLITYVTDLNSRQFYYNSMIIMCSLSYFIWKYINHEHFGNFMLLVFVFFCLLSGLLNNLFVGNTTITEIIECSILSIILALFLLKVDFHLNWVLVAVYIYCAVFAVRILINGANVKLLERYSNNYVSIILLFPTVIYYCLCESRGSQISFVPAFFVWILSLLAAGRSGIVSSTILYIMIFLASNKKTHNDKKYYDTFKKFLLTILIGVIAFYLFNMYSGTILWKFNRRGIADEEGRIRIWTDYWQATKDNFIYVLFGTPKEGLIMQELYEGNAHNSFINIHTNNGIMIIVVVVGLVRSIIFGIKNKKWIFIGCLLAFCVRGFFDNMFWGSKGTFIIMFFLLYPYYQNYYVSMTDN